MGCIVYLFWNACRKHPYPNTFLFEILHTILLSELKFKQCGPLSLKIELSFIIYSDLFSYYQSSTIECKPKPWDLRELAGINVPE